MGQHVGQLGGPHGIQDPPSGFITGIAGEYPAANPRLGGERHDLVDPLARLVVRGQDDFLDIVQYGQRPDVMPVPQDLEAADLLGEFLLGVVDEPDDPVRAGFRASQNSEGLQAFLVGAEDDGPRAHVGRRRAFRSPVADDNEQADAREQAAQQDLKIDQHLEPREGTCQLQSAEPQKEQAAQADGLDRAEGIAESDQLHHDLVQAQCIKDNRANNDQQQKAAEEDSEVREDPRRAQIKPVSDPVRQQAEHKIGGEKVSPALPAVDLAGVQDAENRLHGGGYDDPEIASHRLPRQMEHVDLDFFGQDMIDIILLRGRPPEDTAPLRSAR